MHASKGRGIPVAHVLNILERYFERPWVKQGCRYPLLSVSKCKKKKKSSMKVKMTGMLKIHNWNCNM